MRKEVDICDVCHAKFGICKCIVCNGDICVDCVDSFLVPDTNYRVKSICDRCIKDVRAAVDIGRASNIVHEIQELLATLVGNVTREYVERMMEDAEEGRERDRQDNET